MIQTKTQGVVFGLLMSYSMAFFWNFFFAAPFSRRIFGMLELKM